MIFSAYIRLLFLTAIHFQILKDGDYIIADRENLNLVVYLFRNSLNVA
jgi:hypothetical protein